MKFLSTTKATAYLKALVLVICFLSARLEASEQEVLVARGDYLVNSIVACGNCHTPRGADHKPISEKHLAGAFQVDKAEFTAYSPNITPDRETGIGAWTDDEIKRAITQATSRDGRQLLPAMPFHFYEKISDEDLEALIACLRSIPPQAIE